MGNYVSCKMGNSFLIKNSTRVKVILPAGEIQEFWQPTNAAELMMEAPKFFIVSSNSLKIGLRFRPLNANEDLVKGNVYVMIPMQRKNSLVSANDLGVLFMAVNFAGKVRVQPDDVATAPMLSFEGIEELSTPQFMHRLSISGSTKPLLETIDEETVPAR